MKEYKVVLYRESSLASLFLGAAKVNPVKFTQFLNKNAEEGWRVVTMDKDMQRLLLFFRREAYVVIMERENDGQSTQVTVPAQTQQPTHRAPEHQPPTPQAQPPQIQQQASPTAPPQVQSAAPSQPVSQQPQSQPQAPSAGQETQQPGTGGPTPGQQNTPSL